MSPRIVKAVRDPHGCGWYRKSPSEFCDPQFVINFMLYERHFRNHSRMLMDLIETSEPVAAEEQRTASNCDHPVGICS